MSRADSPLRERMIFAFGARRSGTLWLQRVITAHPAVAAVPSETHLFSHGIQPLMERFQHAVRDSQQVAAVFVERDLALDAVRDLCDSVFGEFLDPDATRLCERTPTHVFHLDLISAIYPDARFVHIIRDGRDVARSLLAQDFGPRTIGAAAGEWRSAIRTARAARLPPDRYLEIRYERLLADPRGELRALYDWLGLESDAGALEQPMIEATRRRNVDASSPAGAGTQKWRLDFSREELRAFQAGAGDLLEELGYEAASADELSRWPGARHVLALLRTAPKSARERLARRWKGRSAAGSELYSAGAMRQRQVDQLVGAIQSADANALQTRLAPNALIRVIGPDGHERQGRGAKGIELLCEASEADHPSSARQRRGDVFPALPNFGLVLRYELPDGSSWHRVLFLELSGDTCNAVTEYRLPLAPPPAPTSIDRSRAGLAGDE